MNTYGSSGVSWTGSFVNAGSKCSRSRSPFSEGLYGGGICFCCNISQSIVRKNACDCMSEKPDCGWQPKRSFWFWNKWINSDSFSLMIICFTASWHSERVTNYVRRCVLKKSSLSKKRLIKVIFVGKKSFVFQLDFYK